MKFSENPMKRSIPGRVGLFMKDDEMWVGNQAEVPDSLNLYQITYHHDSNQENFEAQSWEQIQSKASCADFSQISIKTTPSIKSTIKKLRDKYRRG